MYFSNSSASDNTYENLDIVIYAHANVSADGAISNIATIGSYLPSRVTRAHNNGTYAILSLGMTTSAQLSDMSTVAASSALRATLINNIVSAINTYGLDGVDIDWEFPTSAEKANFTLFMQELRAAVKANNPNHLVMAATGIDTYSRYDFANSAQYIDYISIMTYDMHNSGVATHQSALNYKSGSCYKAISNAYTYYVTNSGINPKKLIIGIPFYGRKFTGTAGLGKSAESCSSISYSNIVSNYLSNPAYEQYWDSNCQVPYLYSSSEEVFITYDNPASITIKTKYAADNGFAGMMYWQDAQDDGDTLFNALIDSMEENELGFRKNNSLLSLLAGANNDNVLHTNVNYGGSVNANIYGSVSNYSTDSISVNTSKKVNDSDLISREYSYGTMSTLKFITIHDTGNTAAGSTALANVNYMLNNTGTSWHYTVGEDSIYQTISENYTAFHAGCGGRVYSLQDTGISAGPYGNASPNITFDASGYYAINGVSTSLRPYTDIAGTAVDATNYTTNQITPAGIYWEIGANGNYYLNKTYYNSTYGKVSNFGGNKNSIGIETTVNSGSDIYQTWQNTAKLVAEILVRNNLTPKQVLNHNAFSGKDCPHAIRNANLWNDFMKMVETEYLIKKYYFDYTITFESLSPSIIDNDGRVIGSVDTNTVVYYRVTVTKDAVSESIILSSIVPAN
ncbi:MAG: N-acetylmuramoyl-L-alanine amidase [Bacilli bacterium]|nr:N-acetylmuramoyl-L-alanine amidase [Bacilli bacterium]